MSSLKNTANDAPPELKKRKAIDGGFVFLLMITAIAGLAVLWLKGAAHMIGIMAETFVFLAELSPKIIAGTFVASSLPFVLTREAVSAWVGKKSGTRGLVLAMTAGAAIPGGPMMIFPLAAGFVAAGADLGAIIAFVSSWNLLGLNRTLIWEFSFFAPEMVWVRWGLSLPLPLLLGMLTRFVLLRDGKERSAEEGIGE